MASPFIKQLKKTLSPKSPLMRLKSPLKGYFPRKQLSVPKNVHSISSQVKKNLFTDDEPSSIIIPKVRHVLILEPNINSLLERGADEKNMYVLGKGSFGTVILSRLKGKKVAVKVVQNKPECCTLTKELNALILSHPNVVDVFQVIQNPNKLYGVIVMEAWSPFTFQAVIEEAIEVNFEDSLRMFLGITAALEYCHEVGIAHLDVKPKNILIDLWGMKSKLCDFGNSHNFRSNSSIPSHIQGTVAYIAPELLKGKTVTEKCDVYSLGITLWQVLHKDSPYPGIGNHAIIYQVVANSLRPATYIHNPEKKGFIKLYERCWHDDPSERPSMSVIGTELQTLL